MGENVVQAGEKNMQIDKINKTLLSLLRCGLFGEDITKNPDVTSLSEDEWNEVYNESAAQGVWGIAFEGAATIKDKVPRAVAEKWFKSVYSIMVSNQKVLFQQTSLISLLDSENIDYVILKGTSASIGYPNPAVRVMGDVDFLIKHEDLERATKLLIDNGYKQLSEEHHCHLEFAKGPITLEMHFEVNGIPDGAMGDVIRRDMDEAVLSRAISATYENTEFKTPDLFSNAIVLILHKVHHILGDGIGLRQLCDWAAFVNNRLTDDVWQNELEPYLKKVGLYNFTEYMNELCVAYLGMPRRLWMEDADSSVTDELMAGIIAGGNFGKRNEVSKYSGRLISDDAENKSSIREFFKYIVVFTKRKWPRASKCPLVIPIGFIYFPIRYIIQTMLGKKPSLKQVMEDKQKRENMFDKIAIFDVGNMK